MSEQTSTEPTATEHLRAGERITLDELAVHLNAAAVWLRQLAVAAETPAVPVDLGKNLSDELDHMARRLEEAGFDVGELDAVITSRTPLAPTLPDGSPWGARAVDADASRAKPVVIATMRQILGMARWHQQTRTLVELPARPQRQRTPSPAAPDGIPYLDGIDGVPGLEQWESPRAAERRARARAAAIQVQARQTQCTTCDAAPGDPCRTKTNRVAETYHRPRVTAATAVIDQENGRA
ncbi:zinc finger domain-containing protein [Actinomadura geliboluensis]|uniref:zinc finger domain-containing protein n=1 Tax=Actinomadura geliboluensis TaxID=882440 RepID=UPI003681A4D6